MNQNDSPLVYSCAFWSLIYSFGPCFQCSKTKSRLHTTIPTVVSSEAVWTRKSIPGKIFSHKAKATSFANLRECFLVKNPHAFGWKWAFSASDSTNLTATDHRRGHGAWVQGQINSTRWRYSHFIYNTYPIPTASLITMELFQKPRLCFHTFPIEN